MQKDGGVVCVSVCCCVDGVKMSALSYPVHIFVAVVEKGRCNRASGLFFFFFFSSGRG